METLQLVLPGDLHHSTRVTFVSVDDTGVKRAIRG
jgi:hypothetical protein